MPEASSPETLVEALRRGRPEAWRTLESYIRFELCRRRRWAPPGAEDDVVCDALGDVWRALPRLRRAGAVWAVARRIARRSAWRERRRRQRTGEVLPPSAPREDPAARNLERDELLAVLLGDLDPEDRELFRRLWVRGEGAREIAAAVQRSPTAVRKRAERLRRTLRSRLRRTALDDGGAPPHPRP